MGKNKEDRKKKFRRMAWAEEYEKAGDGSYVYKGGFRECVSGEKEFLRSAKGLLLLSCAALLALGAGGFLPKSGADGRPYIILPYAVSLVITLFSVWKCVENLRSKGRMKTYVYEKTVPRIPAFSGIAAALCALSLLGLAADAATGRLAGNVPSAAAFAVLLAVSGIAHAFLLRKARTVSWK